MKKMMPKVGLAMVNSSTSKSPMSTVKSVIMHLVRVRVRVRGRGRGRGRVRVSFRVRVRVRVRVVAALRVERAPLAQRARDQPGAVRARSHHHLVRVQLRAVGQADGGAAAVGSAQGDRGGAGAQLAAAALEARGERPEQRARLGEEPAVREEPAAAGTRGGVERRLELEHLAGAWVRVRVRARAWVRVRLRVRVRVRVRVRARAWARFRVALP